jgi:hypothetical protein
LQQWEYSSGSCPGGYCDTLFSGCGTLATYNAYTQRIHYDTTYGWWVYTNSGCTGVGYDTRPPGSAYVSGSSVDMMESSDTTPGDFSAGSAFVEFNPSLYYMTSSGTWYTAANTWVQVYTLNVLTGNGAVGATYYCPTPYIEIASTYGGPWSYGSYPANNYACTT